MMLLSNGSFIVAGRENWSKMNQLVDVSGAGQYGPDMGGSTKNWGDQGSMGREQGLLGGSKGIPFAQPFHLRLRLRHTALQAGHLT